MNKRIACAFFTMALSSVVFAQSSNTSYSGTNSPYSQYGLGVLSDPVTGFNRGMNGLGVGFREHNQVNLVNPAAYSAIDSLTMIFDAGISAQITNFSENGVKKNARNGDFDYFAAGFRALPHLGVGFGLIPISSIGYQYSMTKNVDETTTTTYTNTYSGTGGLHEVYLGMGWEPIKGLSVGANFGYLWGDYSRYIVNEYSDSYANTLSKTYTADIRNYKLDFGVQYALKLGKDNRVIVGVTYGLGHKLNSDAECTVSSTNGQTSVSNTVAYEVENAFELPTMLAGGISWNHADKLKLGFDYSMQQWGSVAFPEYNVVGDKAQYTLNNDYFKDRHKMTLGGEYCKNPVSRKFLDRIRLRAGASYTSPYLRINGQDGPSEVSVSAGFGIPIINARNNRSLLNISAQWARKSADNLIKENTFRLNVGITFNERWFAKWKFN